MKELAAVLNEANVSSLVAGKQPGKMARGKATLERRKGSDSDNGSEFLNACAMPPTISCYLDVSCILCWLLSWLWVVRLSDR